MSTNSMALAAQLAKARMNVAALEKALAGTTRDKPEHSTAATGKAIAPHGTTRNKPEHGTRLTATASLLSLTSLPPPPTTAQRASKSDAARSAELLPEVATLVRFPLPMRELLNWTLIAWRTRRAPVTLEEIAKALDITTDAAARFRDELVSAGMLEQVRVGTLGKLAYRPGFSLAAMRNTVIARKSDAAPTAGLLRMQSKIGLRHS